MITLKAIKACKDPREAAVLTVRRRAQRAGRDPDHPDEQILREGLAQYPEHPDLNLDLAILLDVNDRPTEAEPFFRAAAGGSRGEPFFVSNLATFFVKHARFGEAIDAYLSARNTIEQRIDVDDPDDPERWLLGALEVGLAECMLALGRDAEADVLLATWRDHPDHGPEVAAVLRAAGR